jgi:RimJ/RimL family protein N-acetyltransferase
MSDLSIREATKQDYEHYFAIKCDPNNIIWSGFLTQPDHEKLKERFNLFFDDESQALLMFEIKGLIVGFLNVHVVDYGNAIETSHGALSGHKGKGLGFKMLKIAIQYISDSSRYTGVQSVIGWVAETNLASLQNVLKNGYQANGEVEFRQLDNIEHKFVKYIKLLGKHNG